MAQARTPVRPNQARHGKRGCNAALPGARAHGWRIALLAALAGAPLAACNGTSEQSAPVSLWRSIAGSFESRAGGPSAVLQPAPGLERPYPNLASVPPVPAVTAPEQRRRITEGLVADRANARYTEPAPGAPEAGRAAAAPLPPPAAAATGAGSTPAGAREPAVRAEALAPPVAEPMPADPPAPPRIGRLPAPRPSAPAAGAPAPAPSSAAPPPPPTLDARPVAPAAPRLAAPAGSMREVRRGVLVSPEVAPPGALPGAPPPAPVLAAPGGPAAAAAPEPERLALVFAPGSARLDASEQANLRAWISGRSGRFGVRIEAFGALAQAGAAAGADGIRLAEARAQAVVDALRSAGMPAAAIETRTAIGGDGRGAVVTLLQSDRPTRRTAP